MDDDRKDRGFGKDAGRHGQGQFGFESGNSQQGGAPEQRIRDHGDGIISVSEDLPGGAQGLASAGSPGGTGTPRSTGETGTTGLGKDNEPNQAATRDPKQRGASS